MKSSHELETLTAERREELARDLFDCDTVQKKITEHALEGINRLRIIQLKPLTLSNTDAAQTLCARLKKAGYALNWVPAAMKVTYENGNSEMVSYEELVIFWGSRKGEKYRDEVQSAPMLGTNV